VTHTARPIRLPPHQKDRAAEVLAKAFCDDPIMTHVFPERDERDRSLRRMFRGSLSHALVYGEVYTTPSIDGVACWLSPGRTEFTFWRMLRTGMWMLPFRLRRGPRRRFFEILAYMEPIHKRLAPGRHWYLWALGVEPASQGQGIGSRLIEPVLARADAEGVACYLETETEQNVVFYQRRGFEVREAGEVRGVRLWMMLRPAQSRRL
jgi:ribosomal protein S18 acetylase RimI-like enzyme